MGNKSLSVKKQNTDFRQRPILGTIAQTIALVAALLVVVVSVLLIADHVRLLNMDPLNDPILLELRNDLAQSVDHDQAVVEQIRTYDLYARRAFFSNQQQRQSGGFLLLGGAVICLLAMKFSRMWKPRLPEVGKSDRVDHWELNQLFRQLMAATAVFLIVISLFFSFFVQSDLTTLLKQKQAEVVATSVVEPDVEQLILLFPTPTKLIPQMKDNWPSLRGPGGIGIAKNGRFPMSWDVGSGIGVLWKEEIPVHGFNSPIIWENRLFYTGGDEEGFEIFCHDAYTGDLLWTAMVEPTVELPEISEDTGFSAPSMATDGKRVFAIFATGDIAAFDFEGKLVWNRNLGLPKNPYGMGSSLISDGIRLFIQYDHQEDQKVIALDCVTGDVLWETARTHISWASPVLIETVAGMQLILNDEEFVTSYDPASGSVLWQVSCLGGEVAPSPAFNGEDIVFVANEYAQASALRLNGGTPEILWQYDEYLPEIASPLATKDRFYIATTAGDIICLDALTGDVKWEQEFDEGFNASPILAGNHIYAVDVAGVVHILDANTDVCHEITAIEMGEPVYATPGFVGNRIYIRGDEFLYCIGQPFKLSRPPMLRPPGK